LVTLTDLQTRRAGESASAELLVIKGIGEIGRPKGWSTYEVANASQTTRLPGRKVNRKCTSPTQW